MSIRKVSLGLLVSAVSLYFVLRNVQWEEVWAHLRNVDLTLFGLSMLLMLLAYFLMTWRWQHLLDPLDIPGTGNSAPPVDGQRRGIRHHVSLIRLYGMTMTGYFFNAFFPARAGDLVRAYLLGHRTGLRKTTVLATVVIEKAFDGIALLLMLLLSLLLLPSAAASNSVGFDLNSLAWISGIALVATLAGLVLFYMHNARIAHLVEKILGYLPLPDKLRKMAVRLIETFASGMHVFKNPRPLVSAALISLLVWAVVAVMFMVGLASFNTPFPQGLMDPVGLLFMTAVVDLGLLIPALPGNVGTYEALVIATMAFFRVDKELAVAFALVFHVGQLAVTLVVGMLAFWAQNMSLAEMRPVEEQAEQDAEEALEAPALAVEEIEPEPASALRDPISRTAE
ncbi:MAG: lysylphosphatidylglycerol synthase transmembrane domain-containing protein [Chloroflexia bacterium]